jgi:sodium-dependent dicarboxylate transporter 2/3/5
VLEGYPDRRLATPLILGVAYAASIGGMGTPIGTPPNLVFLSVYEETTGVRVSFAQWMAWAIPPMMMMLVAMLVWLTRGLTGAPAAVLPGPGPWSQAERRVLAVFGAVAAGWVLRSEPYGGWSGLLGVSTANDAAVALLGVVVMGVTSDGRGGRLLDWRTAEGIPWGTLLLFGGGLSLAAAFESTGLSDVIVQRAGWGARLAAAADPAGAGGGRDAAVGDRQQHGGRRCCSCRSWRPWRRSWGWSRRG